MNPISPSIAASDERFHDLLAEYLRRTDSGEAVDQAAFMSAHPEFAEALAEYFEGASVVEAMAGPRVDAPAPHATVHGQFDAETSADFQRDATFAKEKDQTGQASPTSSSPSEMPAAFGRYKILKELGQGAMGAVYLAEDTQLQRRVALKIPKFSRTEAGDLLERFYREARAAAKLRHPNICPVYDVGEINGQHYITMAFIEGRPLKDFAQAKKRQPEKQVAVVVRKLALGLAEAHAHGIIHRDLKPANIMVDKKGEPVVMDFGLARREEGDDRHVTRSGAILGTPAYMSPEQVEGDQSKIGPPADIYSLGVVMYELLTAKVPFAGSLMSILMQIASEQPKLPSLHRSELDPRLETICLKMMAKKASDRYGSMEEVAQVLGEYLKAPATESTPGAKGQDEGSRLLVARRLETESLAPAEDIPAALTIVPGQVSSPVLQSAIVASEAGLPQLRERAKRLSPKLGLALGGALAAVVILFAAVTIYLRLGNVDVKVVIHDKDLAVKFDNDTVTFEGKGAPIRLKPGPHRFRIERDGKPAKFLVERDGLEVETDNLVVKKDGKSVLEVSLVDGKVLVMKDGAHAPASSNYALEFSGRECWAELPTLTYDGSHPLTIEATVISYPMDGRGTIIADGSSGHGFALHSPSGPQQASPLVSFGLGDDGSDKWLYAVSRESAQWNRRMYVAAVLEGSNVQLYVDGKLQRSLKLQGRYKPSRLFFSLGGRRWTNADGSAAFEGVIDELRVSKIARYRSDYVPRQRLDADENTLAMYHFDEGAGDVLTDSSGHNHHGKLKGPKWVRADARPPNTGESGRPKDVPSLATSDYALEFNGTDSWVELPTLTYDGSHPITIEAAVVIYPKDVRGTIIEAARSGTGIVLHAPTLPPSGGPLASLAVADDGVSKGWLYADTREPIKWNRRMHVAGVLEGATAQLYLDGKLQQSVKLKGSIKTTDIAFSIGGRRWKNGQKVGDAFAGVVDELQISKVARYKADFSPRARFEPDEHTLALYHFDEGSGAVLKDSSGKNHHGAIVGAKWVPSPDVAKTSWHGWPKDAPAPAIAPFDAKQAKAHQDAWANYLGVPVDYENSIGMKFRLIPPGEFTMGSTPEEIEEAVKFRHDNEHFKQCMRSEGPRHTTILTQPIYLAANEVTQAEYERIMERNPSGFFKTGKVSDRVVGLDTRNHPVDTVSWNDAAEFARKLSELEKLKPCYFRAGDSVTILDGTGYRLPSEAQWEFACRAGTTTKQWAGDQPSQQTTAAWFDANSGGRTHPVGELKANPFGLYDVHGNVYEWVQDWWDPKYYLQFEKQPAINPPGPSIASAWRVVRGGNWYRYGVEAGSASRHATVPTFVDSAEIGFRLALPVDAVKRALAATPEGFSQVVNLLKAVDVNRDAVHGKWKLTADGLASDGSVPFCRLKLPYKPPAEYDFRVEFTAGGGNDILQLLTANGKSFTWLMGAWGGRYDGFDTVKGHPLSRDGTNIVGGPTSIRRGQRHTSVVKVRRDSISAEIDGKLVVRHATDGADLGMPREWEIGPDAIGLGTTFDAVIFHKLELVVPVAD